MRIALLVALLGAAGSAPSPPSIRLRASPQIAFYPAPVDLSVSVFPNEDTRVIDVATEFTSTTWTIERQPGTELRRETRNFRWKVTMPGEYMIVLTVLDGNRRIQAQTSVTISRVAVE